MRRNLQLVSLAATLVLLLGNGSGSSPSSFNDLGHRMMCMCGCRQILLECNHVGCQVSEQMRSELTSALGRGDSDDLVVQAFVQKYGNAVLAAPTGEGFNLLAWIMPFVALLAGLVVTAMIVRNWALASGRLAIARPVQHSHEHIPETLDIYRDQARKETDL
jgi:cytochrome c-type biogenesis protein CcmH/NrfF